MGTETTTTPGLDDARIRRLIDEGHVAEAYKGKVLDQLLNSYDPTKLTDQERSLAAELRDHFSDTLNRVNNSGVMSVDGVKDYVTRLWGDDADNAAANKVVFDAGHNSDFATNTSMQRKRLFDQTFEGQLLGKKLAVTDPIALAAHNRATFDNVIAARQTVDRIKNSTAPTSDGRPLLAPDGNVKLVQSRDGSNGPAYLVNPFTMNDVRIPDADVQRMKASGELDRFLAQGRIKEIAGRDGAPPRYSWDTSDYKIVDHPALRQWNYGATSEDGSPILLQGNLRVHPAAADYMSTLLGTDQSPMQSNGLGRALLAANREGKGLLLGLSPFHVMQEGLRAVMTGISPFGSERWDLSTDPILRSGVEQGLTLGTPYDAMSKFQDSPGGHSTIISKIPGLAQTQDWMNSFLFEKFIPGLKARAFRKLYADYGDAHPDWTAEKVAREAADDTNSRFGGLNTKLDGRSALTSDIFRTAALAPDWLESELKLMARTFGDNGGIARRDMLRLSLGLYASTRVVNCLVSGKLHPEAPFGVVVPQKDGSEKVISVRTMPTDMLHAISDPGDFLSGRISPLGRAAVETVTGRDNEGRKMPTHNLVTNILQSVAPIPIQSAVAAATGARPDLTNADQIAKAAGLTVYPYQTSAGRLAAQLASDRSPTGQVDPSQLARHQALMEIEDNLRTGAMQSSQLFGLVDSGTLSTADAKAAVKSVRSTQGLPSDTAKLYTRASRLPMPDFLRVYDVATPSERRALAPLLQKKRAEYLKKATTTLTPVERGADQTYARLRAQWPNQPPW